jgi:hypothetical protein
MSNEIMTVGSIRTTVNPSSGIYEALLEKAERERDEAREALSEWEDAAKHVEANHPDEVHCGCVPVLRKLLTDAQKENEEQARLLGKGSEREARLITERDHYKQALEEVSSSIDDWLNSLIQEPSLDFIHAIKAWADKKLKEI